MSLEAVGGDGSEDGDDGGGDVRVREVEIDENSEADGEAGGANEIKGKLFANGGGRRGDDLFENEFGNDGYVAAVCKLLEGLKERVGLAKSVVAAEVHLDLSKEYVHLGS
ncbi:hypothetical protein ACE6H2_018723 [Prunus campanulata]